MPAAKLRPVRPRTTTVPPVMYSHPWSPTPSTTAVAPELRTQNRSPTCPRRNSSPLVAPYAMTLPAMMFSFAANPAARSGRTTIRPPDTLQGFPRQVDQGGVERLLQAVVLAAGAAQRRSMGGRHRGEQRGEVEP